MRVIYGPDQQVPNRRSSERENCQKMKGVFMYKFLFALVVVWVASMNQEALAVQHVVGGSQGWEESADFSTRASAQKFKVGDQLVFKYTSGLHSVVELGIESAYKSCDIGSSVDSMIRGNNVVKLNKPGTRYFACGTLGHCDQGMEVKITTVAANASDWPKPSSSSPASTSTAPALSRSFASVVLMSLIVTLLIVVLF
ncbi:Uclacyanin 1 like [Actinidia chinensis var. chinensis]|uniref:Uclacyanin 1 like n=1 Tax=Actinidia chinensis var. chinensis TaxID=1590841 RepID=A0A2R6RJY9_ACTCC|nr:Uclacyanin 1 like [Actinidia chinensis var. chinensis]